MSLTPEQQLQKIEAMKEYHSTHAINQSALKKLYYGPKEYLEELNKVKKPDCFYFEESESLVVGSGVDMKVSIGEYGFNSAFFHPQLAVKPSPMVMSIMNQLYDENPEVTLLEEVPDASLERVMTDQGYRANQNWGIPAKLKNLKEEGGDYFKSLALCKGRQILSSEELVLIGQMADNLKASPRIQRWINPIDGASTEPQSVIYFEHEGHQCKAMLDFEWVDHEKKQARALDVKTTKEEILNFPAAMRRWRYDLQGAFYTLALRTKYPDYKILPPVFLVESSTNPGTPMDFVMDDLDINDLIDMRNRYFVTLKELFTRLEWYNKNGWENHYLATEEPIHIDMRYLISPGTALSLYSSPCKREEAREPSVTFL